MKPASSFKVECLFKLGREVLNLISKKNSLQKIRAVVAISIIMLMLFLPLAALAEAPDQDPVLDNSGDTNNDSDSDSGTTGGGDVGGHFRWQCRKFSSTTPG